MENQGSILRDDCRWPACFFGPYQKRCQMQFQHANVQDLHKKGYHMNAIPSYLLGSRLCESDRNICEPSGFFLKLLWFHSLFCTYCQSTLGMAIEIGYQLCHRNGMLLCKISCLGFLLQKLSRTTCKLLLLNFGKKTYMPVCFPFNHLLLVSPHDTTKPKGVAT